MNYYVLKQIARAIVAGDALALEYKRCMREYTQGKLNVVWLNIARLELLKHLKLY